jgi:salicylate hydroxylase
MAAPKMHVALVGAGIGGLAAAVALNRRGCRVTVYEQAAHLHEVGVGMHLSPNGARLLRRLGLGERLHEVAMCPEALEVRAWDTGATLFTQPMGPSWAARFGAPHYTVHRADLHRVLAEQLQGGQVRLGRRLVGFTQNGRDISDDRDDAVRLEFADGDVAEADVLVGADGVHSVVRRAVAGAEATCFSGHSAYRGVVPADRCARLSPQHMFVWAGPQARLLCYPMRQGRLLTCVAVVPSPDLPAESWSTPGDPVVLKDAFSGWNTEAADIVEALAENGVRRWALHDREPLTHWASGRVTLLGDAAHPMLPHHGQGASQAIEDAVALAHFLSQTPWAGPSEALRRYEALRQPHTARVQLATRGGGTLRMGPGRSGAPSSLVDDVSWIQRYDITEELTQ